MNTNEMLETVMELYPKGITQRQIRRYLYRPVAHLPKADTVDYVPIITFFQPSITGRIYRPTALKLLVNLYNDCSFLDIPAVRMLRRKLNYRVDTRAFMNHYNEDSSLYAGSFDKIAGMIPKGSVAHRYLLDEYYAALGYRVSYKTLVKLLAIFDLDFCNGNEEVTTC